MALNLSPPTRLDGTKPDPTGGRGFVDKDNKTRLGRAAEALEVALTVAMDSVSRFADDNFAFNRIPLKPEEEADLMMSMGTREMEEAAGVFGPERVVGARRKTARHLAAGKPVEPLNLNREEPLNGDL